MGESSDVTHMGHIEMGGYGDVKVIGLYARIISVLFI